MRCGHAGRLMSLELDRALSPEQAGRLAAHLARCARCRQVHRALQRAEGLLAHPEAGPTPDLTAQVLARLPQTRRAVIPAAPAWTRASGIVAAALLLVLLGVSGAMVGAGLALGPGDWLAVQSSGRSVIAVGWGSARELFSVLGVVVAALWQALRWPWAPLGGGTLLAMGAVWTWLWVRSGRGRS